MHQPIDKPVVVIGYGSTLRGDDAVGRLVAERSLHLRACQTSMAISCTQLVPELAPLIAEARAVIFVDAAIRQHNGTVEVHELKARPEISPASHIVDRASYSRSRSACYDRSPPAWLMTVPANRI